MPSEKVARQKGRCKKAPVKGNQAEAQERFALNDCTVGTLSTYRKFRMVIPNFL